MVSALVYVSPCLLRANEDRGVLSVIEGDIIGAGAFNRLHGGGGGNSIAFSTAPRREAGSQSGKQAGRQKHTV